MVIDIRILGPIQVTGHGGVVHLGGGRLRTLFGLLTLRAPQVVSRNELIDGLWDDAPPANAAKTLRTYVAYLRQGLTAAGMGGLIATRPPGYALAAPIDRIDMHSFEELVHKGRSAGAAEATAVHLRTALRLWRGEVMADCTAGRWAQAEMARLHEVRLYATEELLAADLTLGRHAQVAAELERLVTAYPLRERMWELLMVALHMSGRPGDALLAYQRARNTFVEELGLEPGRQLRRLEMAILCGDR